MPTVTQLTVKQDVLRALGRRDEAIAMLPVPLVTTGGGSTTTLVDTKLGRGTTQANRYDGRQIEITAAGSNAGEHAAVDDKGFNGASTLTFSPALTSVADAATYLMYPLGLSGDLLKQIIDEVLRDTDGPHIHFPSMCPDSDLEGSSVADWWNDIGDAPTVKAYVSSNTNRWVTEMLFGQQSLHVTESATSTGVKSDVFDVGDTETLVLSCFVHVVTGTLTISLYNETAGADIGTAVTVDEPGWKEVRIIETVTAACEQATVRFAGSAQNDDFYVASPVIVQAQGSARHYELPSWFVAESQYAQARSFPLGLSSEDANTYVALSASRMSVPASNEPTFLNDARGVAPFKVLLEATADGPVFLIVQRAFDTLADNTTTTTCDRQYLRSRVIATILRDWGDTKEKAWSRRAMGRAEVMGYNRQDISIRPNPPVSV
jgi:hypothetical protein